MEDRGQIPPGLPRDEPTVAYWQDPPDGIADFRSSELLPQEADIVIVGSGISGATIAFNLLSEQPKKKVVLLEARQAASGASGRNGRYRDKISRLCDLPEAVFHDRPVVLLLAISPVPIDLP